MLAAELVRLNADVIVAGAPPAPEAAQRATSTIPIVMANHSDPVGSGLAVSLAKPGKNVTGVSTLTAALLGKRVQLFREAVPGLFRVAVLWNSTVYGVIILTSSMFYSERRRIAELAAQNVVPAIYGARGFAEAGGLMAYGIDIRESFHRAATYVDKILKGAKPANLPVELPTKFELVINAKTAKALSLTIPRRLLSRADEIIQ